MGTEAKKVSDNWLQAANRNLSACAIALGAVSFLVAHDIPQERLDRAAAQGETVSTIFQALGEVGQRVETDRAAGLMEDKNIVRFWQDEIRRAANRETPRIG